MASVLHGGARTTPRLRAEFQASKESSRALAARYGLNAKTVRKWRKRTTTADAPIGPKKPTSAGRGKQPRTSSSGSRVFCRNATTIALRHGLQLRQAIEGPEMANALSGHQLS